MIDAIENIALLSFLLMCGVSLVVSIVFCLIYFLEVQE